MIELGEFGKTKQHLISKHAKQIRPLSQTNFGFCMSGRPTVRFNFRSRRLSDPAANASVFGRRIERKWRSKLGERDNGMHREKREKRKLSSVVCSVGRISPLFFLCFPHWGLMVLCWLKWFYSGILLRLSRILKDFELTKVHKYF